VSSLSSPRSSVCAVASGSHLYAIGGRSDVELVNIVERFDSKEKAWYLVAPTLECRVGACDAAVSEKVFLFGGFSSEVEYSHTIFCEIYDPVTNMWSSIANAVTPRVYASAVSFKGDIYVCGDFGEHNSLQIYDIVASEWKFCTTFPQSDEQFRISCLRIPREVLDKCPLLS